MREITLPLCAKLFRGLADINRLSILNILRQGPMTVSEVVDALGLTQPNVSNHLACLRECGLVTATAVGRFMRYQISDVRVDELLALGQEIVEQVANGVSSCQRYRENEDV